jgi:hypothetical protein
MNLCTNRLKKKLEQITSKNRKHDMSTKQRAWYTKNLDLSKYEMSLEDMEACKRMIGIIGNGV